MGLSMSSYYHDPKVSRSLQEELDADLRGYIENIRIDFPKSGYRTLMEYLRRQNVEVSEYRLRNVLKKFKLQIRVKKRYVHTTNSNHGFKVYPNLVKGVQVKRKNQVWVADITYIRIENGFVYLAVIIDRYSRKVIGWSLSKSIDGNLTLAALKMAHEQRGRPTNVIHHSDRGVQYLCEKYTSFLETTGYKISCSAKGNPYDNAFAESFMRTLKVEQVDLYSYKTILDVLENVPNFLEEVYNKKRVHSSLGYLTPEEFESKNEKK